MAPFEFDKIARRNPARDEVKAVELNLQQCLDDAIDRGGLVVPFNSAYLPFFNPLARRQQLIKI